MARERRTELAAAIRERIRRALQNGALHEGSRLPSARELGAELDADPRVIGLAYRTLVEEGLVEIRPRSGAYVATRSSDSGDHQDPPAAWLAGLLADAVLRGVPATALADWLVAATTSKRTNVAVVAGLIDQADGLARELRDDYGLEAAGVLLQSIVPGQPLPRALQRAHLLLTTPGNQARVQRLAERVGRPLVIACVRQDLMSAEWTRLLRDVVYVVVADRGFESVVREFVRTSASAGEIHVLVAGRDDVRAIPAGAATYVTAAARAILGSTRLPGRVVPPARILTEDCVREIMRFVVERNLASARSR